MDAAAASHYVQSWRSWRGAVFLAYGCLLLICAAAHWMPASASGQFPVLLGALWLVVQCWSLLLLAFFCRTHLFRQVAKLVVPDVGGRRQPQMLRRSEKTTRVGRGAWFGHASCEMQGWRASMEDAVVCCAALQGAPEEAALFAVFDGHGGAEASAHAAEQIAGRLGQRLGRDEAPGPALKQALLDIEEDLRSRNKTCASLSKDSGRFDYVGCTAAVAMLTRTTLTVVNVGDSRVFKCRNGECVPLTRDHKPESPRERRRIEAAGGRVVNFGPCHRVDYNLNLSRSLGDFNYKDPSMAPEDQKISPAGDVTVTEIDSQDEFLVVACDGVFELMTWNSCCAYVHERIQRMPLAAIAEGLLEECCSPDMLSTCGRGTDNESVIIVKLQDP